MIHRIFSDLPSFKELSFQPGLNLLLADKSPGATERQTRNGAGKTSLIELIHFLAGSECGPDSIFRTEELEQHTFGMELDLGGAVITVKRSGNKPRDLTVSGDTSRWLISPFHKKGSSNSYISNTGWKTVLGNLMFGLPEPIDEPSCKFGPSFRSLFAYFVRRQSAGAFLLPTKQSSMQQVWDQQVAISYLLGLDWTIPQQWQIVRERENGLKVLRKAAIEGTLGAVIGTTADLRTQLTLAEQTCRQMGDSIRSFHVVPEYHDLEREASELTRLIAELSDGNTVDYHLISELNKALHDEMPPSITNLERLYEEVGVSLPEVAVRRFEDVRSFHQSVIENRKSYLSAELTSAQNRVADRDKKKDQLDERRSQVMAILQSSGALEQYNQLRAELTRLESNVEDLRHRYDTAETLEGQKTELEIERGQLQNRLRQDYREQRETLAAAILAFEKVSNALYENSGSLTISPEQNGPSFGFQIQGARSKGINNMQIFCFDVMLARLFRPSPGFLVHDSHLFDGVDERQIATALQVGSDTAAEVGFQYIVTMNSDTAKQAISQRADLEEAVLPVTLTDAVVDGGLFGIRFG